ncbi:MAG: nucleoside triphosphate pyrophosphohydrolase [Pseudomonadota bacterium]|nr:nucleoside triphosphate pyrophosphohydrolase [Pseudomonadota bacterium]
MTRRNENQKQQNTETSESFIFDSSIGIEQVIELIRRLRDDKKGCPWDKKQTNKSLAKYTIEEAYEVADSAEKDSMSGLCEELGDLLFNILFHSEIAAEKNLFTFKDVINRVVSKMVLRHPHVFGGPTIDDVDQVKSQWEEIKRQEKNIKTEEQMKTELNSIPISLPALTRALMIQKKASQANFDWNSEGPIIEKIYEEISEYLEAGEIKDHKAQLEEFGDILFSVVNLGRFANIDPETALRRSNDKFLQRMIKIEELLKRDGTNILQADLTELNNLWEKIKISDKKSLK